MARHMYNKLNETINPEIDITINPNIFSAVIYTKIINNL